jgi:hypothetical protein
MKNEIEVRQQVINNYLVRGQLDEAVTVQREIVAICLEQGDRREAVVALHQLIGLAPNETWAYFQLSLTLRELRASGGEQN